MLKMIGAVLVVFAMGLGCATKEVKPDPKDAEPTMVEDAGVAEDAQEDAWTED